MKPTDSELPSAQLGWKEPNTHVILERLLVCIPRLKYIHVMRNGLDMSYSSNQQQLLFWGPQFLGRQVQNTPTDSLKYWCISHKRINKIGSRMPPDNFLLLNFDQLCLNPEDEVPALLRFLGADESPEQAERLVGMISPPESIGRHRKHDLEKFDSSDREYVVQLGFKAG